MVSAAGLERTLARLLHGRALLFEALLEVQLLRFRTQYFEWRVNLDITCFVICSQLGVQHQPQIGQSVLETGPVSCVPNLGRLIRGCGSIELLYKSLILMRPLAPTKPGDTTVGFATI